MNRRNVLTLVELTLVTAALAAALPILAHAANYGTSWGAPALAGVLMLTMLLTPVTLSVLVVLAHQELRVRRLRRERADLPPSARTPLQVPSRPNDALFDVYAAEFMGAARHRAAYAMGEVGRHAAPPTFTGGMR